MFDVGMGRDESGLTAAEIRGFFPGLRKAFEEVKGLEEEADEFQLDEIDENGKGLHRGSTRIDSTR